MLRKAGGIALLAACTYTVTDALNDALIYMAAKSMILQRAAHHERFIAVVGQPISVGPAYNSSIDVGSGGMVASCTIPVSGSQKGSDVRVKLVRTSGFRWSLMHNLTGGEWEPLVMDASMGNNGGIPIAMSLLEAEEPELGTSCVTTTGGAEVTRPAPTS